MSEEQTTETPAEASASTEQTATAEATEPTPLEQQALDAINALKDAGTEIPDALNAVVKEFRDARKEAGNHRTAKSAEKERADAAEGKLSQVLELLGMTNDDDPDPDALQAAIAEREKAVTAKTVEFDAYRAANKHGANPDALLDSASFLRATSQLDPSSETYKADLESAIKTAVETNPLLAAASPGGGRGRGPAQGPRPTPTNAPTSLEDAFANHYS